MAPQTPARVLQVVQRPQRRGAELFASELNTALRRRGIEARSVYLYPAPAEGGLALGPDDLALDGDPDFWAERIFGFDPRVLGRLRRVVRDLRPDVVQVNGARTVKYGALAHWLDRDGWALVYRNIGDLTQWMSSRRQHLFYRHLVMPRIDAVVSVSEATLDHLRALYDLDAPLVAIPNAVDLESFRVERPRREVRRELGVSDEVPVVVYVGSLTPEKRLDRLLRVVAAVRRSAPDLVAWIVGEGPERDVVAGQLAPMGLDGAVDLLGSRSDVADVLAAADVLLLTSDTEGMPGVILEAGAARVPVVATRVGGVASCVTEGRTGLLADPADEAGLARAVGELLADPRRRAEMGAAARRTIEQRYALDAVVDDYLEVYRSLVGRSRSGRSPASVVA